MGTVCRPEVSSWESAIFHHQGGSQQVTFTPQSAILLAPATTSHVMSLKVPENQTLCHRTEIISQLVKGFSYFAVKRTEESPGGGGACFYPSTREAEAGRSQRV